MAEVASGLLEQRIPALLQLLLPWQAGPGRAGGGRAPCTVVSGWLGDHTHVSKLARWY